MVNKLENKTLTFILLFNMLMTVLVVAADSVFYQKGGVLVKAIASGLFVLFCAVNILIGKFLLNKRVDKFLILLLVGQFFAAAGDVVLEYNFPLGAGVFAIGHIFFFVAYYALHKFSKLDVVFSVVLACIALSIILFYPDINYKGMLIVLIAYAIIISSMVGKAISNVVVTKGGYLEIVALVGAVLFFASDMCLLFRHFAGAGQIMSFFCLYTYYPSHCFLALSAIVHMLIKDN